MSTMTKDTRLHIRYDHELRCLLDKTAAYAHMSVSEFVFKNAVEQAQSVVAGFYTPSAASITTETLPEKWRKKLPRYPVSVALLGHLAVHQQAHGWASAGLNPSG